jgi:hypothetical protein
MDANARGQKCQAEDSASVRPGPVNGSSPTSGTLRGSRSRFAPSGTLGTATRSPGEAGSPTVEIGARVEGAVAGRQVTVPKARPGQEMQVQSLAADNEADHAAEGGSDHPSRAARHHCEEREPPCFATVRARLQHPRPRTHPPTLRPARRGRSREHPPQLARPARRVAAERLQRRRQRR